MDLLQEYFSFNKAFEIARRNRPRMSWRNCRLSVIEGIIPNHRSSTRPQANYRVRPIDLIAYHDALNPQQGKINEK